MYYGLPVVTQPLESHTVRSPPVTGFPPLCTDSPVAKLTTVCPPVPSGPDLMDAARLSTKMYKMS